MHSLAPMVSVAPSPTPAPNPATQRHLSDPASATAATSVSFHGHDGGSTVRQTGVPPRKFSLPSCYLDCFGYFSVAAGPQAIIPRLCALLGLIAILGLSTMWLASCGGGGGGLDESRDAPGVVHDHRKWHNRRRESHQRFQTTFILNVSCSRRSKHTCKTSRRSDYPGAPPFPALQSIPEPLTLSFSSAPRPAGTALESFPSSCERCA